MDLVEGTTYLLEEPKPVLAFRLLELTTASGWTTFCVTRQLPERVRQEHDLGTTPCLWLSEVPGEGHHSGKALAGLAKHVVDFLGVPAGRRLVLLDGLEYLIENNGFDAVLDLVEHLNEFIMTRRAVLLIPVSPKALDVQQVAKLERDLAVPDVLAWLDEIDRGTWTDRLDRSR